jgi:uncharacterized protein (TIGR03083 family)
VKGLDWSVGELASHLGARTELFAGYLSGTAMPEGGISDIAEHNQRQIRELADVPYETHVELIAASLAAFVDTTKGRLGTDPYPWYSDLTIDVATGTGVALAEVLVHGYDIARSLGRPWRISADDARTIARASLVFAPYYVDPRTTAGARTTYRLLIRGGPRVRVRVREGTVALEPADGPAECTIRAEPVAFVLLSFGRIGRWRAAARGRLLASGRKPWKAFAFSRSFLPP